MKIFTCLFVDFIIWKNKIKKREYILYDFLHIFFDFNSVYFIHK